jgi:hypothetical protein
MTEFLREVLAERARVAPPTIDPAELLAEAQRRIRRRRLVSVAAAAVVTAMIAGGAALMPSLFDEPAAVDRPARFTERLVSYAQGSVVHYGDQAFDIGVTVDRSLAPTDYGFVVANSSGEVWFTDGSETVQVGERLGPRDINSVKSDATGALAAWVERNEAQVAELVVYDTRRGEMVARVTGNPLGAGYDSHPRVIAVDDDAVYWNSNNVLLRYDVAAQRQTTVELPSVDDPSQVYDVADGVWAYRTDDLPSSQILVGAPGTSATIERLSFGEDLSPDGSYQAGLASDQTRHVSPAVVDVATGEHVTLRPPRGYDPHQYLGWVDADTVAVWDADEDTVLACAVPAGSCRVASKPPLRYVRPVFPGYQPG